MKSSVLLFALMSAALHGWAQKSPTETMLGTISLKVGMAKEQVIAKLASQYRIEPAGDEDWWSVDSQPPYTDAVPFDHFANLAFTSGRLVYVSKRLFNADRGSGALLLANSLYVILTDFIQEQSGSCAIATRRYDAVSHEEKRVSIQCGRKIVTLEVLQTAEHTAAGDAVVVNEIFGVLPSFTHPLQRRGPEGSRGIRDK
jgi:hypothetical protein